MYSLYTIILKACIKSIFKHEKRVVSWINVKQKNIIKQPSSDRRGSEIIQVKVEVPTNLTEKQKNILKLMMK